MDSERNGICTVSRIYYLLVYVGSCSAAVGKQSIHLQEECNHGTISIKFDRARKAGIRACGTYHQRIMLEKIVKTMRGFEFYAIWSSVDTRLLVRSNFLRCSFKWSYDIRSNSVSQIKSTWKNFKDMWNKRRRAPSGSAGTREWPYMDAMAFLEKCDFHGRTRSIIDDGGMFRNELDDFDAALEEHSSASSAASQENLNLDSQPCSSGSPSALPRSLSPIELSQKKRKKNTNENPMVRFAADRVFQACARMEQAGSITARMDQAVSTDRFQHFGS
ncbi:hypothetical protein OSTOST_18604, partial [Ostertagia ostertagi]